MRQDHHVSYLYDKTMPRLVVHIMGIRGRLILHKGYRNEYHGTTTFDCGTGQAADRSARWGDGLPDAVDEICPHCFGYRLKQRLENAGAIKVVTDKYACQIKREEIDG